MKSPSPKQFGMDLTTGSVPKQLLLFTIPFMASTALQVLYSMIDMIIVGQFCDSVGLSAVSLSSQLVTVVSTLGIGFAMGAQILIAQLLGARDFARLRTVIGTMFSVLFLLGVVLTGVCIVFYPVFLQWINTPSEAFTEARNYMLICSAGILFIFGYNAVSALLRGLGDSRRPLVFIAISSVLNVILDYLFVGPMHMGAAGAALATIISQAVSFLISLFYLLRHREQIYFDFRLRSFRIVGDALRRLIKVAVPLALELTIINVSMLFVNAMVSSYGVAASASFGVRMKLEQFPNIAAQALGAAASAMVAQNFGARNAVRAQKTFGSALLFGFLVYAVVSVLYLLFPELWFRIFTQDRSVLDYAWLAIWTLVLNYPAHAIMVASNALIRGSGNTVFAMFLGIFDGIVLRIGLSYVLGQRMGITGFYLGYSLATYGTALPGLIYYLSGIWKKSKALRGE